LDALAGARNYYGAIVDQFLPFFGRRVLEAGAGIGTFARAVLDAAAPETMTLVEPAANNLPVLRERFAGDRRVDLRGGYLEELAPMPRVDSVVAVNVLEHIEDDARFLRAAHAAIAPGGHILLYVPALRQLYGSLDEAFQHFRRYTKAVVLERLDGAGFEPVRVRYTNLPGVLSWFLAGRVFRRRTITARDVALYDRVVMPWVTAVERWWEPWVGQSIIAIARRA
jgi:SAM-dependent methyltransferase